MFSGRRHRGPSRQRDYAGSAQALAARLKSTGAGGLGFRGAVICCQPPPTILHGGCWTLNFNVPVLLAPTSSTLTAFVNTFIWSNGVLVDANSLSAQSATNSHAAQGHCQSLVRIRLPKLTAACLFLHCIDSSDVCRSTRSDGRRVPRCDLVSSKLCSALRGPESLVLFEHPCPLQSSSPL